MRGNNPQRLVALNIGPTTWEEFESSVLDDGLPMGFDLFDLLAEEIKEPKHLLRNFRRLGQVAIISGASKTYKSWTMMELALAVSQGTS